MANMNFGVNILPKANNTYSLGNSDYKWNIFANTINGTAVVNLTLPAVTASNNGQILQVSNGAWAAVDAAFLTSHQDISHLAPKASPEFTGSISMRRLASSTVGLNSMAIGYGTTASANEAIATGYYTVASGTDSTAIGYYTTASAQRAFASGDSTTASNNNAHAEGYHTTASGSESHAEGNNTTASNYSSHAEGYNTIASGYYAHAEGRDTLAQGTDSHAEGWGGKIYIDDQQVDAGAIGSQSHSEGYLTRALGSYSHAEGGYTSAADSGAHAEGYQTTARGYVSHAEGLSTQATAYASHAEGYYTVASNGQAHAEGANTNASGYCAHTEGYNTTASNSYTHAEGENTIAAGSHQHVSGKYNIEDTLQIYEEWEANKSYEVGDMVKVTTIYDNKTYINIYKCKTANSDSTFTSSHWNYALGSTYAEIIGNGTADDARSNARVLDWSGNERLMGDLYVGCASNSSGGNKVATETYVSTAISNIILPTKVSDLTNDSGFLTSVPTMTGATSNAAGASGLVPAPSAGDENKFLAGDGTFKSGGLPMVILSYGNSTWAEFEAAYKNNVIVYARASSNSNPASGSQTRMAFMAYVNNATVPTEVEFQYYRSMSSHSATAMGDQVFVYKLTKTGGWSVTTRDASIKQIKVDTNDPGTVSWSGNVVTLKSGLPKVTSADEGKILKVVNGAWAAVDP